MKGRTFRRCASCGRSPGAVAAGRRCPHKGCNGRITWAWSINLGKVSGKRRRLTGSSDEWGDNFQTDDASLVTFEQAFVYDGAGSHVLNGTKTGQVRRVKLDPGTLDGLRRHLDQQRFERRRLAMDPEPAPENPVFVNVKQERIRPDYISRRWAELCDRAGVRRIRLHDARHTAASLFLDKNVPIHQVSAVLGHATPAVTHQTYSHVIGAVGEATAAVVSLMYDNPQDDDSDTATGLRDTAS